MTWIYHAQLLARMIRSNEVAEPNIVWRSSRGEVSGWGITLSIDKLGASGQGVHRSDDPDAGGTSPRC